MIRDKIVKCPDEHCSWVQFRNICGVQLSVKDIASLIKNRRTPLLKGMKSKSGKKFNAYIVLDDNAASAFEFENKAGKKSRK